eukprot:3021797-Alexandrium_andersonii.AAC.1
MGRCRRGCAQARGDRTRGNSESADLSKRKYKYHVVVQGNRVVDQNCDAAILQDLGSTPATLEASRIADAYGSQR